MTKAPTSMGLSQREVPKRSTDAKGIILKISFVIAADMHQNIIALHHLVRNRHHRVLGCMPFFRCKVDAVSYLLLTDDRRVRLDQ